MDAALVVSICAFLGLLGVLAGLGLYLLRSKSHLKQEEEEEEEVQEAVVRRRGAGRGGLRNRRRGGRQALGAGTEEEEEEDEEHEEEVQGRSREARRQRRREEKRRAREEQRDADEEAREAREGKANLYDEARRERERLREEAEAAQEEEIRHAAEERQRQEEEEAEKWRSFISVEDEGQDALEEEEEEKLMERMASWIREQKAVALDDIAVEFKMKTAEVISRIQVLEGGDPPRLTGIMDDRGKYIYISEAELRNVADFIKGRGRISIAELAARSNELLDMSSHQQAAPDLLDLDLDNPVPAN